MIRYSKPETEEVKELTEIDEPIIPSENIELDIQVDDTGADSSIGCIEAVMSSYQNANKWLDTIKEEVLMVHGCPFFSDYIHNLAHTMPVRFDKFGDILHTCDIIVPYPSTQQFEGNLDTINDVFIEIFRVLDEIKHSLNEFIKLYDGTDKHGMACAAEGLLNDIESEYPDLYRLRRAWGMSNEDNIKFDKFVRQYMLSKESLI